MPGSLAVISGSDYASMRRHLRSTSSQREAIERDVTVELDSHIAMRVEALMAPGLAREAARAEALRRFGDFRWHGRG